MQKPSDFERQGWSTAAGALVNELHEKARLGCQRSMESIPFAESELARSFHAARWLRKCYLAEYTPTTTQGGQHD